MNIFELLAYISGGFLVLFTIFLYILPSRKSNIFLKAISEIIVIANGIFIYLYTENTLIFAGIATTSIALVREIVFYKKDDIKMLQHIAWPIAFSVLFCLSLIITYKSPISLLPVIGSVASSFALYASNKKLLNTGVIASSALYVVYYALLIPSNGNILTIFSLLSSSMGIISGIIGLIVLYKKDCKSR